MGGSNSNYGRRDIKVKMTNDHLMAFPVLITERLKLRQLSARDGEEIFALRSNPTVNKYLNRQPCTKLNDALSFIQKINEAIQNTDLKYWGIELNESQKLVGTICLFSLEAEEEKCEIGYELLPAFQGKGIMSEAIKAVIAYAFQTLGLKTIDAYTHQDNQNSTNLLQKCNFEKTEIVDRDSPNLILSRLTAL